MKLFTKHDKASTREVGGKAMGLYTLVGSGCRVPDFFVIPSAFFESFFNEKQDYKANRELLSAIPWPSADRQAVLKILDTWGFPHKPVAVRSSVADEDGEKNAFPGMMDSFLNIRAEDDLFVAINQCATSAFSDRVLAYRKSHALSLHAKPAVIIQKQIDADFSGVLFTTNPSYPQELAIHSTTGLGDALVQGNVSPDEFYFNKKKGMLHRKSVLSEGVPADNLLLELFCIGSELEKKFGKAHDIEFCSKGNQLFILQMRPITQKIPQVVVYDNSNIQESYCGVTTPLTFSFAQSAYAAVYTATMRIFGIPKATIKQYEEVVNNLLGLVKGRIYYNINNWYKGLQLLPSFKQNKADMERMMGVEEPIDFVEDKEKSLLEKLSLLPSLLVNLSKLLVKFNQIQRLVDDFHAMMQHQFDTFYLKPLPLDYEGLKQIKQQLDHEILQQWTTPIVNDFNVMMANGKVIRKLNKLGISNAEDFIARYMSGDNGFANTLPTKGIVQLANEASQIKRLKELILKLPHEIHAVIKENYPDFYQKVTAFIDQFGDRTVGELKLETITMRIEPLICYKYIANFLGDEQSSTLVVNDLSVGAKDELHNHCKSKRSQKAMIKSLEKLKQGIGYRESMRLERTKLFGMYRALFLQLGKLWQMESLLEDQRDIFYLEIKEIFDDQTDRSNWKELVKERKDQFDKFKKQIVASRVEVPSPPTEVLTSKWENGHAQGTACYPGHVSGEVIVINDPGDSLDIKGKIIAAVRTDPGWAALFPKAKGVLIEKGSMLSHSVILLRELGIPTIINIKGLTQNLKSGDQVSLDGESGEIHLLA